MTEPEQTCSRCNGPLGSEPTSIRIEGGPLNRSRPVLLLCPHCVDSLTLWLARSHRRPSSSSRSEPSSPGSLEDSISQTSSLRRRPHRHRRRWKSLRRDLAALLVVFAIGGVLYLIFALTR